MIERTDDPAALVYGIAYVELYVSNTYQAAHFYRSVLGFEAVEPPPSLEQRPDRRSIFLQANDIRLLLTAPVSADSSVAEHLRIHGEGVKDIALDVAGMEELFRRACECGAEPVSSPYAIGNGRRAARVSVFGDIVHTLIEGRSTDVVHGGRTGTQTALDSIDHLAIALNAGELDRWVNFYKQAFGFRETHQEQVNTEYSAMRSKVVESPNGHVRFPMMEAAAGLQKSQIEMYVESHSGPGTQHLAFQSRNIAASVKTMMAAGLDFLPTPAAYYDRLEARVGPLPDDLETLRALGILADRDRDGLLFQVFTKPIGARPTLFLELVERRGAAGFGSGNIRALFEAVERANMRGADA